MYPHMTIKIKFAIYTLGLFCFSFSALAEKEKCGEIAKKIVQNIEKISRNLDTLPEATVSCQSCRVDGSGELVVAYIYKVKIGDKNQSYIVDLEDVNESCKFISAEQVYDNN